MMLDSHWILQHHHTKLIFICNKDVTNINYPFFVFNKFIINKIPIIWNMLCVCKHGCQPSMNRSIPCSTILNDIFLGNISTCENNHNLLFIPLQCPFTYATCILTKWIFCLVHDGIGKMLVLHHLGTITLKDWLGNVGTLDIKAIFSMLFLTMASIALFFMNLFFISIVCI